MVNVVHILGPNRTGSTVLHLMLGNSPDAFACGELYAAYRPWRSDHRDINCYCSRDNSSCKLNAITSVSQYESYQSIADNLGVKWIVDESKRLSWVIDTQSHKSMKGILFQNIATVKSPDNYLHSLWKRKVQPERASKRYIEYYSALLSSGLQFKSLDIDEFLETPADNLRKLCEYLDMPYFEGKEEFWRGDQCFLFGSSYVRRSMQDKSAVIEPPRKSSREFRDSVLLNIMDANFYNEMKGVYAEMRQHEIQKGERGSQILNISKSYSKGSWYYRELIQRLYRRAFPATIKSDNG